MLFKLTAAAALLSPAFILPVYQTIEKPPEVAARTEPAPRIQAAILLDVSNSMDGLIEQAKAQLWNMVSVMGKAKCNEATPQIEIALYEYGRPTNNATTGYVRQLSPFTSDLDRLSKDLFSLTTNGGDEYCGHVMYSSLAELSWDTSRTNYKVIFISGNEDFLQGDISYRKACAEAKKKGVIINTIYCGDRKQGIAEHWNIMGECGGGSFTNIDPNAAVEDIPTPYDSAIMVYNGRLNGTYLAYGAKGQYNLTQQAEMDRVNYFFKSSVGAKRAVVKGNAALYNNAGWDMVDAAKTDSSFVQHLDRKALPDSLKNKTRAQLEQLVHQKKLEREKIQREIQALAVKREAYVVEQRKKNAARSKTSTLEMEMEKIIRTQAARFNMQIQ